MKLILALILVLGIVNVYAGGVDCAKCFADNACNGDKKNVERCDKHDTKLAGLTW